MKVLSLFDGLSCGRIALERAKNKVDRYYASEIEPYAELISKKNYKNIIRLGDVNNWKNWDIGEIDLLFAGFPCQSFSTAGKGLNFDDPRGQLFFRALEILKHYKPKYFLFENVPMKEEFKTRISDLMGVEPILVDSGTVSAQNRKRLYWTNLKWLKTTSFLTIDNILDPNDDLGVSYEDYHPRLTKNYVQFDVSGKGYSSQQDRAYYTFRKFGCFPNARAITKRKIRISPTHYRNLTLNECERLQTLPEDYTLLDKGFSLNKSLSAIGNGWTVDVIVGFLKNL